MSLAWLYDRVIVVQFPAAFIPTPVEWNLWAPWKKREAAYSLSSDAEVKKWEAVEPASNNDRLSWSPA